MAAFGWTTEHSDTGKVLVDIRAGLEDVPACIVRVISLEVYKTAYSSYLDINNIFRGFIVTMKDFSLFHAISPTTGDESK